MNSVRDPREEIRESLKSRLQGRGLPVGDTVFTGAGADEMVTDFDASMIRQLYLVTERSCPGCSEVMDEFLEDIQDGTLQVVDVGDEKGFEIVKALNPSVPALVDRTRGRRDTLSSSDLDLYEGREDGPAG